MGEGERERGKEGRRVGGREGEQRTERRRRGSGGRSGKRKHFTYCLLSLTRFKMLYDFLTFKTGMAQALL